MKIKLVTDSTSDLTAEEIAKYDIEILPVSVNIDGTQYDFIDNKEYIYKMREAKNFSTSQPAVGLFLDVFKKWTDLGYTVISIHISSAISGTYSTAYSAAQEFENVYVIDSKTTSRGLKYFIDDCYSYVQEGKDSSEIVELLNNKQEKVLTYVTIDKLDNLVKGGRLKKSAGLIGGLLNIKILTKLYPEELSAIDKVRGKKKLVQSLIENIKKDTLGKKIKQITLADVLSDEYVKEIREAIAENFNYEIPNENIHTTTPAISTHTGEGAVGVLIELD